MLLQHLVANAVVYSADDGQVELTVCGDRAGEAYLSIRDHGLGIEAEKMPRIFDDYYRSDEAVRHCRESTGLGLAIVRRIATSHRIRICVGSMPGQGTQVELFFTGRDAHAAKNQGDA